EFHGAYNKLLHSLFPSDTPFTVIPQYFKYGSLRSCDFQVAFFEIVLGEGPVLILELKRPSALMNVSSRQAADQQIRERLLDLANSCPIRTLRAISAMGTRLSFYHLGTINAQAEIEPLAIPRHPTIVNDTAPEAWWDCDVLDANGEVRLRAVVDAIKEACQNNANA
ncbi:hypothetical protein EDD17DRAFT_1486880, partial [Pisolithus thermaeus]